MKRKLILTSMLALATLVSCNKKDNGPVVPSADSAYLSIQLSTSAPRTYAGPGTENGTPIESNVNSVVVVGFQGTNKLGVYTLTASEQGTIAQGTGSSHGDAFKIDANTDHIFVLINPTASVLSAVNSATTFSNMNAAITESVSLMTVANKFMMTSAGSAPGDHGLVVVSPKLAATESATDINAAKTAAEGAPYSIKVDRTMSKTTLAKFEGTVVGGEAEITGWKVNTSNTKYYPYAELVAYTLDGTTAPTVPAVYREDPNFSETGTSYATEFNWLHNEDNVSTAATPISWNAVNTAATPSVFEYVLENTMAAAAQNYNNTTKITIQATYAPTGVTLGDSWFRMDGTIYTLDELKAIYANPLTAASTTAYMDKFYADLKPSAGYASGAANFGVLTIADLDAVENGGYLAAKVKTTEKSYLIEYFQKSVCYYDVNLNHDSNVTAKLLGRWGVVRNNYYTLDITKISQPGKPYIPDPTDPDITDPENPDPDDPDPDDETSAYISATITINPWTTWTQEVEL